MKGTGALTRPPKQNPAILMLVSVHLNLLMFDGAIRMNEPTYRTDYAYDPEQETPSHLIVRGYYIDKIRSIASEKIEGKDEARMRCATFKEVNAVCRELGQRLKIRRHRVYPALNIVGRDKVYNQFKIDGSDIFSDIKELRERRFNLSYSSMIEMDEVKRFIPTTVDSVTQRVTRSTKRRAQDIADDAGIRTSELNLYFVMYGMRTIIEVEPQLMYLADNEIVNHIMGVLRESEDNLQRYCKSLKSNTDGVIVRNVTA